MRPIFFLLSVQTITGIPIGIISDVMCIPSSSSAVIFNGTCQECLCYAFVSNSSSFAMINCYATQSWCELFHDYLSTADTLVANANATLFFLANKSGSNMISTSKLIRRTMIKTSMFSIHLDTAAYIVSTSSTSNTCELMNCMFLFSTQQK